MRIVFAVLQFLFWLLLGMIIGWFLMSCASPAEPFDWDWTPVEAAPLRWSYPQVQPLWTYPTDEQLELRNHYRPPVLQLV